MNVLLFMENPYLRRVVTTSVALLMVIAGLIIDAPGASATAYLFSQSDLNGSLPAGTQSKTVASFPVYTVSGGGTGIGGTADTCTYTSLQQAGNIEFTAKVLTQTNTNPRATAGLMIRQNNDPGAAMAVVGVSPLNGVNFTSRQVAGSAAKTTLGPTVTVPVWVRLAVSGEEIAGYMSADGLQWDLVGKSKITLKGAFSVGLTVCSYASGTACTATFSDLSMPVGVPQPDPSMVVWYRSDLGLSKTGSVVKWQDQSVHHFTASNSSGNPTISAGLINNQPAVVFSGDPLKASGPLSDLSAGYSMFYVVRQTSTVSSVFNIVAFQNPISTDLVVTYFNMSGATSEIFKGTTLQPRVVTPFSAPTNTDLEIETQLAPGGSPLLSASANGSSSVSTTTSAPNNVTRQLQVGIGDGAIAEILIYNRALSLSEVAATRAYFYSKYALGSSPILAAPILSPPGAKYAFVSDTNPPLLTMQTTPGALTYYTTDGSPVTTSSKVYSPSEPIEINQAMTITAASAFPGSSTLGPSATSAFEVSPIFMQVPTSGQLQWLSADSGVATTPSNQTSAWYDLSGNNLSGNQTTSSNMPVLSSPLLNGSPVVNFSGTQYLALPATSAVLNNGFSSFCVASPGTFGASTTGQRIWDFASNAGTTNDIQLGFASAAGLGFFGSTSQKLQPTGISANTFQVLEGFHAPATAGSFYLNGALKLSGAVSIANATRAYNYVGADSALAHPYIGSLAEQLIYNKKVDSTEQKNIENYLLTKYQLIDATVPTAVFTPASGATIKANVGQVTASAPANTILYFTTNGTAPTTASPVLQGPYTPTATGTLTFKVLPVRGGFPAGAVQTATYTVN